MAESYNLESVVQDIVFTWRYAVEATLSCWQESFNPHESYAVAMIKW